MPGLDFPDDFVWGAATASFQVEGAGREDGRGETIWDTFCRVPGKVHQGDNGEVACDHYHRYKEDIELMRRAGMTAYRFSIAWSRILPSGTGAVNRAGLDHYRRVIAEIHRVGLEPVVTLYHWDLPQALQDAGGWSSRETAFAFLSYVKILFAEFGDSVGRWITLNEPFCSAYLGHLFGCHAPGIADPAVAYRAVHHLNLAHGLAVKAYRETGLKAPIGIVWNLVTPRPATRRAEDRASIEKIYDHDSRMFTNPVLGKPYPERLLNNLGISLPVEKGDMDIIGTKIDFIGLNYYMEGPVSAVPGRDYGGDYCPSWERTTDMGWSVTPEGLLRQMRWMACEAPGIPLYITENGCAEKDVVSFEQNGVRRVHDPLRIDYLREHLRVCSRAIAEGIPLKGYFVWSFIDNFEWGFGYSKRFGIVYCDYQNLERIPKDSYYFYRDVIAGAL